MLIPHEYLQTVFLRTFNRLNLKFPDLKIRYGETHNCPSIDISYKELYINIYFKQDKSEFLIDSTIYNGIIRTINPFKYVKLLLADPEVDKSIVKACESIINEYSGN